MFLVTSVLRMLGMVMTCCWTEGVLLDCLLARRRLDLDCAVMDVVLAATSWRMASNRACGSVTSARWTTCTVRLALPLVIDHTCRSCMLATPGTPVIASLTRNVSMNLKHLVESVRV